MHEDSTTRDAEGVDRPLADPAVERRESAWGAMERAERAAWRARRMLDASRGLVIGQVAFAMALPAALMIWWDSSDGRDESVILGSALSLASTAWLIRSLVTLGRRRAAHGVRVVDAFERAATTDRAAVFRGFLFVLAVMIVLTVGWSWAFRVMPSWGVAATMWTCVAVFTGIFVGRFAVFRFWEDLVFATGVFVPWAIYLSRALEWGPLTIPALVAIAVATYRLDRRWLVWSRATTAGETSVDHAEASA